MEYGQFSTASLEVKLQMLQRKDYLKISISSEVNNVSRALALPKAPLDILLLRGHALPIPYLTSPSISFLTHISPMGYLALMRDMQPDQLRSGNDDPAIDIPAAHLRAQLQNVSTGITIATLSLDRISEAHLYLPSMSMPNEASRPTFALATGAAELDHTFPYLEHTDGATQSAPFSWVLDFTGGGRRTGVVMSQSRMKAIELVVNPLGGSDITDVPDILAFGSGSWVDLLVCSGALVVKVS